MRSFSRRTASLDNYTANKKVYDDMAQDPELAQYVPNNINNNGKSAYKISNVGIEESDDTDSTSESSDDSTDDSDDTDGTTTEGTTTSDDSDTESDRYVSMQIYLLFCT